MELQGVPILHQGRSCGSTLPRRQCRFHGSGVSSHRSHGAFGPRCAVSVLPIIILHRAWPRSQLGRRSQGYDLEERLAAEPWRQGFEEAEETPPVSIEGQGLPKDLIGTVYRNSPGRLRIGASKYEHWFDGDGFVSALSIDGERQTAAFASRFVRTPRYVKQEQADAFARAQEGLGMASVGAWTPADNGEFFSNVFRLATNPANTSVLWWADRLLALCEGGLPYRIDPGTLETMGEDLFSNQSISESGVSFFSAHPKRDPKTGELFNIGLTISLPEAVEVYCCSARGELLQRCKVELKEFTFIHDFAITEQYIVLIMPPWVCPTDGLLQSLWEGGIARKFQWQEELGTRCVILKRSDLTTVSWFWMGTQATLVFLIYIYIWIYVCIYLSIHIYIYIIYTGCGSWCSATQAFTTNLDQMSIQFDSFHFHSQSACQLFQGLNHGFSRLSQNIICHFPPSLFPWKTSVCFPGLWRNPEPSESLYHTAFWPGW